MSTKNQLSYRFISALLIVVVLSAPLVVPTKQAEANASSIVGKCAAKVISSKGTAYAIGLVVAGISYAFTAAQTPIAVPSNDLGAGAGGAEGSGQGAAAEAMTYLEPLENCIIHETSQLAIDAINKQVRSWIKTGLNGNPNYATGLNKLFLNLSTMVTGELQNQIAGLNLCDFTGTGSFKADLGNNVALSTRENSRAKYAAKVECPFPGATAQDFYSDFNNGGWGAFETALSDNGNQFGVTLQTSEELAQRSQETLTAQEQQLTQSGGFSPVVDTTDCTFPDGLESYLTANGDLSALADAQRLYCRVTTPGKTVADQLSQVVGSDMSRLMTADSVNTILDGFITDQVNDAATGIFQ